MSNQNTQQALPLPEKEVIQPHLPVRLPCYDFTPVTSPAFGIPLLAVKVTTSGMASSHSVTGGVYKARARIDQIGRASCRGKSVDLGGRRIIKKKNATAPHKPTSITRSSAPSPC